ncbi:MAG: signal peptidase I [Bacillota bacterium]|nr:signal peptidase I [Bacillota bacterium]
MLNRDHWIVEYLESIVIALVLALIIRTFVFQPFYIPSGSMEPTLAIGDRIIVSKFSYYFNEPVLGDVVVFKYPLDPSRDFIKRVIGVPGDIVEIKDSQLFVNGLIIPEEYVPPLDFGDYGPIEVPKEEYFVLGDNRTNSQDSRSWGFVPEENVVGKAQAIFWPFNRIGAIR